MAGYYISLRPKGLENLGEDLHITLAYLGKLDDLEVQAVKDKAFLDFEYWRGLQANIYGVAVWIAGPSYFTVGLIDGWEVRDLHDSVVSSLLRQGITPSSRYPFNPHVTLVENKMLQAAPMITKRIPFTADTLYLSKGDVHIPLTSKEN